MISMSSPEEEPSGLPRYYTAKHVASIFAVSDRLVHKWAEKGVIGCKRIGKTVRFTDDHIHELHARGNDPILRRTSGVKNDKPSPYIKPDDESPKTKEPGKKKGGQP